MRKSIVMRVMCGLCLSLAVMSNLSCVSDRVSLTGSERRRAKSDADFAQAVDEAIKAGIGRSQSGIFLTDGDKQYLLNVAHAVMRNYFSDNPEHLTKADFDNIPANISFQSAKLYITLLVDGRIRACRSAVKGNLLENTISAAYRSIDDERFGGPLRAEELPETRIDFTFLLEPTEVKEHKLSGIKKNIELGMHAISLQRGKKRAFYKSSVPVSHGYSLKTTLKRLGRKAKIGSSAYEDPNTKIYRYNTCQFSERFTDKSFVQLYRTNVLVFQSEVDRDAHLRALRLCGDYMTNHVNAEGLITYEYDTYRDEKENPVTSTSMIRRLASTWMLASIGNYFDNSEYRDAARRSIDHCLEKYYVYDPRQSFGYIQIGENANLALASFMLCSLLEIGDQRYHAREKQQLINFILAMEDEDKGFLYPVYLPDKETNFERKEVYYPGEALTALMLLYEDTHNREYLAVAERVFDYYRGLYERSRKKASMSPWMSKAYSRVFFATRDRKYADFVFRMNDYVLSLQEGMDKEYVDKIGSFFSTATSSGTGVMVESIAEAYKVAKALNDVERTAAYRKGILMGNRFILQCQYTDDNMFTARNRDLALGGMRSSIYESAIRIDSNQHGGCALLEALQHVYDGDL